MYGNEVGTPEFYLSQGPVTEPDSLGHLYGSVGNLVKDGVDAIQGLFLHIFWAGRYGVTPNDEQKGHVQSRLVSKILDTMWKLDQRPLNCARELADRFFGNCRDHAVFLSSLLRAKGIPARARCGFATYFVPGHYEDHWICQYWSQREKRWVSVDPQLDKLQQDVLKIGFDPLDMPAGQFLTGAEAWTLCRQKQANPDDFGIFNMHGLWFIRGNLVRDLASLNKVEMLPWDCWGIIDKDESQVTPAEYGLLDWAAELVNASDVGLYAMYENESSLRVPDTVRSYIQGQPAEQRWQAS